MDESEGKEFAVLGVKSWLIKQLFSLGLCHFRILINLLTINTIKTRIRPKVTTTDNIQLRFWLKWHEFSGIKSPTPIQKGCIPGILDGADCIGAAKTGSGKTFAFALPILQNLAEDPYGIFALVLTPTHELAYQVRDSFQSIAVWVRKLHWFTVDCMQSWVSLLC